MNLIPLNKHNQKKVAMDIMEFTQKERQIEEAKHKLKARFIGLDKVIDQLIDSLRTWYHISHFQTRPLVINLWGSVGVGKSQLVKNLINFLGLEDSYFSVNPKDWQTNHLFESITTLQMTENPVKAVFCIDDFQKLFNSKNLSYPWDKPENNLLWEILDEGMTTSPKKSRHELDILEGISKGLSFMVKSGLKIKYGFVNKELIKDFQTNKKYWEYSGKSIPKSWRNIIGSNQEAQFVFNFHETKILFDSGHHGFENFDSFVTHLKSLDQHEILDLVNLILQRSLQSDKVDLSHSLFFVIGNLECINNSEGDSKYNETGAYNKLSPGRVREILGQYYLPAELIARLGNNHIIFPKPSTQDFEKIIERELLTIQSKFEMETGASIEFDNSVVDWILNEGVVPELGVRPVFSTIQNSIIDNLPSMMLGLIQFKNKADRVTISMDGGLDVKYRKGGKTILQSWHPIASWNKQAVVKQNQIQ